MIGFTETKLCCINTERSIVPLRAHLNKVWMNNKFTIASSREKLDTDSTYKPGGVMQITTGSTSARIRNSASDEMGRWTSQMMIHANGKKSYYYTVYRVCQKSAITAGPTTAAMQQWRHLRSKGIEEPNPRKQFMTDLQTEITDKRNKGYEIFVMGDFNTPIHDSELQSFMHECNLFDLHEPCSNHSTAPATFKTGTKKIDHMLGTYFFIEATISACILSWEDSLPGDHRCLIIDLCKKTLQSQCDDLTTPQERTLISTSPQKAHQYNTTLDSLMNKSKIAQRLDRLSLRCSSDMTDEAETKFHKIDEEMSGYMLHAEKHFGKSTKNPRHHYSPKLSAAGKAIHAIKKQRKLIEAQLPWTTDTEKVELRAQIPQLDEKLKLAWINLKQIQAHSRTHRQEFLQQQATMYANQHSTSAANAIAIIIRSKQQKRMFSKIRRYLKPNPTEPLDRILIPDGQSWKEVTDAQEIFSLLTKQAIIEMSGPGTDKTPFTITPLDKVIPPWSPSEFNDQILEGTYQPPPGCTEEVRDLFKALVYKDGSPPPAIPLLLTTEDLEGAIKSKAEKTASSPSGRHLGHYKTALNNSNALQFHLNIINFARTHTCLPPRWSTAIQIRIPKKAGMPHIDKLRMIQLLEFDMNAQFGTTIGRQMIWNAEDNGQFSETPNFGNRPNTQVSSCTLLEKIS